MYKCELKIMILQKGYKNVKAFSESCGVNANTLSSIMNGHRLPSFDSVYKICRTLDMRPDEIWKEQE
ncbi:Helix-turn-helix [Alteribacillus persepolensis]|uniref:Helix-turn-helix n=2 Tax=Alteribacillus persepolensis TaxID=568899 RepID=A0A1G8ICE3_9BACI|nr:Helix-turn-helix [Alteribacillus persepolensis]